MRRPPAQEEPSPGGEQGGAHAAAPAQQDGREAERPWLAPYILVKIVDKRLRGGRCACAPPSCCMQGLSHGPAHAVLLG